MTYQSLKQLFLCTVSTTSVKGPKLLAGTPRLPDSAHVTGFVSFSPVPTNLWEHEWFSSSYKLFTYCKAISSLSMLETTFPICLYVKTFYVWEIKFKWGRVIIKLSILEQWSYYCPFAGLWVIFTFFVFQFFSTVNIHTCVIKSLKSSFKYLCIQTIDIFLCNFLYSF